MSIVDDLRNTAVTAATVAIGPLLGSCCWTPDPQAIARIAVEAATPFIEDATRVESLPTEQAT
jgi:hypothetical protein